MVRAEQETHFHTFKRVVTENTVYAFDIKKPTKELGAIVEMCSCGAVKVWAQRQEHCIYEKDDFLT